MTNANKGRNNKLAGQIGEFLVCAELGRRGLIATPFSGNVPTFDILVADNFCRTLPIQVKASRSDNWPSDARDWMNITFDLKTGVQTNHGAIQIPNPDLIYVCVAIAPPNGKDRFFILTKSQLQQACIRKYSEWMGKREWKRPRNPSSYDCRYWIDGVEEFEDNWELILNRFNCSNLDNSLETTSEQEHAMRARKN